MSSPNLPQINDPNGNVTQFGYGGANRVISVRYGDGGTFSYTYNAGNTVSRDPNGHTSTYFYDRADRVTKVTDDAGNQFQTSWTADNHVQSSTDAKGQTTSFGYDANNNLTSTLFPTGANASWAYTDSAHPYYPTSSTDTQGNTLTYTYDANGNQKTTTDQLSSQNQFSASYNANGTVSSTTDARGNSTSYGYDAHGNLTGITPPAPLGAIAVGPDALSRVHTRTDGKGQTTTSTYDNLDRVTNIHYQDGSSIAYVLDNDGNVLTMTDNVGTTTYGYDGLNRQYQKLMADNSSANYRYDPAGNLVKLVTCGPGGGLQGGGPGGGFIGGGCTIGGGPGGGIIGGRTTTYAYNDLNEVTSLTDADSAITTFGYDANHHRTTTSYPNGVTDTTTYDNSQRISAMAATGPAGPVTNFTYSYTNPATSHDTMLQYSEVDSVNNETTATTYDVVNRLTEFKMTGSFPKDYQYQYDGNGNRVQQFEDGVSTSYAYNAANEITTAGTLTYTFDANGNELSNSAPLTYGYNAKNQTSNVTGGGVSNDMAYTGPGQNERLTAYNRTFNYTLLGMYSQTVGAGGVPTYPITLAGHSPSEVRPQGVKPATATAPLQTQAVAQSQPAGTTTYTKDPYGTLISETTPSGKFYYDFGAFQTGLGPNPGALSVRALTASDGSIVATYLNCATGNVNKNTGTEPNSWVLQSSFYDHSTTTQMYFGNGLYDATIGRWNQTNVSRGFAQLTFGDLMNADISPQAAWNWANAPVSLPNSRFFTGPANIGYGIYKVVTGVGYVVAGTAADVSVLGGLVGVPSQAYGGYQIVTGVARTVRGVEQLSSAVSKPTVNKSPVQYTEDIGLDVAPLGGAAENFLGGLP